MIKNVHENESIYIPIGAGPPAGKSRQDPARLIEVQTGQLLWRGRHHRIEDDYRRA